MMVVVDMSIVGGVKWVGVGLLRKWVVNDGDKT